MGANEENENIPVDLLSGDTVDFCGSMHPSEIVSKSIKFTNIRIYSFPSWSLYLSHDTVRRK